MTELNHMIGMAAFLIVMPFAVMCSMLLYILKKNDKLRDNVKEVAKEKGKDAIVKGIEWILKGRK